MGRSQSKSNPKRILGRNPHCCIFHKAARLPHVGRRLIRVKGKSNKQRQLNESNRNSNITRMEIPPSPRWEDKYYNRYVIGHPDRYDSVAKLEVVKCGMRELSKLVEAPPQSQWNINSPRSAPPYKLGGVDVTDVTEALVRVVEELRGINHDGKCSFQLYRQKKINWYYSVLGKQHYDITKVLLNL